MRRVYNQKNMSLTIDGVNIQDFHEGATFVYTWDGGEVDKTQGTDGAGINIAANQGATLQFTLRETSRSIKFLSDLRLRQENGGLISIAPTLTGPMQIQSGVKIKALYVPGISAGHSIKVNSTLNTRLSGMYRIHTMSINIDAYSEAWTMDIESFRFPPGKK